MHPDHTSGIRCIKIVYQNVKHKRTLYRDQLRNYFFRFDPFEDVFPSDDRGVAAPRPRPPVPPAFESPPAPLDLLLLRLALIPLAFFFVAEVGALVG